MATQRQITANRANALRSTGPVTPEGKRIASQNSTRHGILAQTVVLEGESRSRFEELLTEFIALLEPRTAAEAALVETMTIARWKQMRIWGIEKAGFQLEMSRETSAHGANATRGYLAFKKLADNSRVLDLQHRYETGYERQFCRAYAFLLKIRAKSDTPSGDLPPSASLLLMPFSTATPTWESSEPCGADPSVRSQPPGWPSDADEADQPQENVAEVRKNDEQETGATPRSQGHGTLSNEEAPRLNQQDTEAEAASLPSEASQTKGLPNELLE